MSLNTCPPCVRAIHYRRGGGDGRATGDGRPYGQAALARGNNLSFAALSVALEGERAPAEIRLLPSGVFHASAGLLTAASSYRLDPADGARLAAAACARRVDYVIDYEHQTLLARDNGKPAPAAGWFSQMEMRADGLYAVDVRWTSAAKAMLAAGEYRYFSPVFSFAPDGRVLDFSHAALTNVPALEAPAELAVLSTPFFPSTPMEDASMEKLLAALAALLNLPEGADADAATAAVSALSAQLKAGETLPDHLKAQAERIAALSAQTGAPAAAPDPAKYVPVSAVAELQTQLAALSKSILDEKVAAAVDAGLASGKLPPSLKGWALDVGRTDFAALSVFLEKSPQIAALSGMQTSGVAPSGGSPNGLSQAELAVCSQLGVKAEDFTKFRKE